MLPALVERGLDQQAIARREQTQMLTLVVGLVDQVRRVQRRVTEARDDIELMVKAELMGRLGHSETQIEARLNALTEKIDALT